MGGLDTIKVADEIADAGLDKDSLRDAIVQCIDTAYEHAAKICENSYCPSVAACRIRNNKVKIKDVA